MLVDQDCSQNFSTGHPQPVNFSGSSEQGAVPNPPANIPHGGDMSGLEALVAVATSTDKAKILPER